MENIKKKCESLQYQKSELEGELDQYKLKVKELEERLPTMTSDAEEKCQKLTIQLKEYDLEINKLKESLQINQKERDNLMDNISNKSIKIKELEEKLSLVTDKLQTVKNSLDEKTAIMEKLTAGKFLFLLI